MTNKTTPDDDWLSQVLEDMAESYYPEHEYNDMWRDRNAELRTEAHAAINAKITELLVEELIEIMHKGEIKTLIGKYPTGEDKYSYSLDNALIGKALRKRILQLAQLQASQPINEQEGKI